MEAFISRFKILVGLLVLISLASCGNSSVSMSITDAPVNGENISEVYVAIKNIDIHTNSGGWETMLSFSPAQSVELLALTGGNTEDLGNFTLPSGTRVTQIRFYLEESECYLLKPDDTTEYPLQTNADDSGFKATGSFEVPLNGPVELIMDFDVQKSLGSNVGGYFLKPTTRIISDDVAGQISGAVTDSSGFTDRDISIYAYENGTYSSSESSPDTDGIYFTGAVTSGLVHDEDGDGEYRYKIAFLSVDETYDLYIAEWINGTPTVLNSGGAVATDLSVEGRGSTTKDITLD